MGDVDRLELSRSKAKHPPAKVSVEARKIKAEVSNSEKKRRQKNMEPNDPRNLRISEMDAEIEAKNRREQSMTNANEIRNDEVRLSQAEAINERADEYMRTHGTDYPTAVKEVVRLTQSGQSEPSVAEVERYMRDNNVDDFGVALRSIMQGGQDHAQAFGSTASTSVEDENSQLEKVLKARGYDS